MKKSFPMICFLFLLLVSCRQQQETVSSENTPTVPDSPLKQSVQTNWDSNLVEIDLESSAKKLPLAHPSLTEVFVWEDQVFYLYQTYQPQADYGDYTCFVYSMETGETTSIGKIDYYQTAFSSFTKAGNSLYYAFTSADQSDYLVKINLETFQLDIEDFGESYRPVVFLYPAGDNLVRTSYAEHSGQESFQADLYDGTKVRRNILNAEFDFDTQEGRYIFPACVSGSALFCTELDIKAETGEGFYIGQYTLDGALEQQYKLEIADFHYIDEVEDYDTLFSMRYLDGLFDIHTLNGRDAFFQLSGGSLIPVEVPSFFAGLDTRTKPITSGTGEETDWYFSVMDRVDGTGETLCRFDPASLRFTEFAFLHKENILIVARDTAGNLLVCTQPLAYTEEAFASWDDYILYDDSYPTEYYLVPADVLMGAV